MFKRYNVGSGERKKKMNGTDSTEILRENVGMRIAYLKTSITAIANANNINRSSLSQWCNGNPTVVTLDRLARCLGVEAWALLHPKFNPREWPEPQELRASV